MSVDYVLNINKQVIYLFYINLIVFKFKCYINK